MRTLWMLLFLSLPVLSQDSASVGTASAQQIVTVAAPVSGFWGTLQTLINSPMAATVVAGVVVWVLGRIFTAKPSWRSAFDEYRGAFFDAVRYAENMIPDGTPNAAAAKADIALKFLLRLEGLSKVDEKQLRAGIVEAHRVIEEKENPTPVIAVQAPLPISRPPVHPTPHPIIPPIPPAGETHPPSLPPVVMILLAILLPFFLVGCKSLPPDVVQEFEALQKQCKALAADGEATVNEKELGQTFSDVIDQALYRAGVRDDLPADVRERMALRKKEREEEGQ